MVGKIIKYDLLHYIKTCWFVTLAAIIIVVLGVVASFMHGSQSMLSVLSTLVILCLSYGVIFSCFATVEKRFRSSIFSGEGYMTMSIPISTEKLLLAKIISAFIVWVYTCALAFLSLYLFSLMVSPILEYEFFLPLVEAMWRTLMIMFENAPISAIELILICFAGVFCSITFIHLSVAVGHLFKGKQRLFSSIFALLLFFSLGVLYTFLHPFFVHLANLPGEVSLFIILIIVCGASVGFFFGTRYIIKHKLNLVA